MDRFYCKLFLFDSHVSQNELMSLRPPAVGPAGASRLRKPSWKDPRLLVGILLVCASVAGVVALVDTADRTVDVYALKANVSVGTEISPADLTVVGVRLGSTQESYVSVEDGIDDSAMAISMLRQGELLAVSAVGSADDLDRQPVGLSIRQPLSESAQAGSMVDVWVSLPGEGTSYQEPELLLQGVEISAREDSESALGGSSFTTLEVLVSEDKMASTLSAISNEAKIAVIPNPGGGQ